MDDFLKFLVGFFVIIIAIFAGINKVSMVSCKRTAIKMQVQYDYSFSTGCMINVDGHFIPLGSYRKVDE